MAMASFVLSCFKKTSPDEHWSLPDTTIRTIDRVLRVHCSWSSLWRRHLVWYRGKNNLEKKNILDWIWTRDLSSSRRHQASKGGRIWYTTAHLFHYSSPSDKGLHRLAFMAAGHGTDSRGEWDEITGTTLSPTTKWPHLSGTRSCRT